MKEGYKVAKAVSNTKFKTGDKVKCINNTLVEQWFSVGKTYTVAVAYSDNEHIGFIHTGFAVWHSDRFELIEKKDTVKEPKRFNPRPGDKIICNNGIEFICCCKETIITRFPTAPMIEEKSILGYRNQGGDFYSWQSWYKNGQAGVRVEYSDDDSYDIREVIPKQKDEINTSSYDKLDATQEGYMELRHNQDGTISALNAYTAEDIRSAFIDDLSWTESYLEMFMKSLEKVTKPEYKEYLRLKDMFENEQ